MNNLFEYTNIKTVGLPNINLKNYLKNKYLIKVYIVPDTHYNMLGIGRHYFLSCTPNQLCDCYLCKYV